MKGFTRNKKFIPMTDYKKVTRKSRDSKTKTQGTRMKTHRFHPKGYKPPTFEKKKPNITVEITETSGESSPKSWWDLMDYVERRELLARYEPKWQSHDSRSFEMLNPQEQNWVRESFTLDRPRKKRDSPVEFSRIENLKMIKDKNVKDGMIVTLNKLRNVFAENKMEGGMIWSFLEDTVDGQILISLDKKPDHYVNTLSDFYIDDRVGFRGVKEVSRLMDELKEKMRPIVKYDKPRFVVGDIVKPEPESSNVAVSEAFKQKPDINFRIVEMERGLDPHYIGYQIVDVDEKPFKKNWIYAGNDNLIQGEVA